SVVCDCTLDMKNPMTQHQKHYVMERVHDHRVQRRMGAQSHVTQRDPEDKGVRSQEERTMFKSEKRGHRDDGQTLPHMLAQPAQQEATKEHLFEDRRQEAPASDCDG